MLRVLLAIDDYAELVYLQTLLKKIGFDVDGAQTQRACDEAFLRMNPEVLIAAAFGKRISGFEMVKNLKRPRGLPKVVLLVAAQSKEKEMIGGKADAILESPADPRRLLETLALVGGLSPEPLIEKYMKLRALVSPKEVGTSSAGAAKLTTSLSPEQRQQKYQQFMSTQRDLPKNNGGYPKNKVTQYTKDIRATENIKELEPLEDERQAFAKQLFKQKPT